MISPAVYQYLSFLSIFMIIIINIDINLPACYNISIKYKSLMVNISRIVCLYPIQGAINVRVSHPGLACNDRRA